jgi:hypothetical protein
MAGLKQVWIINYSEKHQGYQRIKISRGFPQVGREVA